VHFGTRTDRARLANSPDAPDLSSDAQLLHLEGDFACGERCMGKLGQTRAYSQRTSARVDFFDLRINETAETPDHMHAAFAPSECLVSSLPDAGGACCVSQECAAASRCRSKWPGRDCHSRTGRVYGRIHGFWR